MHFHHGGLDLSYTTFGQGARPAIALHGFGRSGADFAAFAEAFGGSFTLHAFDLPFHGRSASPPGRAERPFEPQELRDLFRAFALHIGADRIALVGYSLGGRLALSLLETMPQHISQAVLIAPDGLKTRPWYRALASSPWGRKRYAHFIDHPQGVHRTAGALHAVGLMNDRMHRFVIGQTDTREKRLLLHDVWLSFRNIEPGLARVAANVRQHQVPVMLVFGARDSVITPTSGARLRSLAPEQIQTVVVDAGHQLLTAEVAQRIAADLFDPRTAG